MDKQDRADLDALPDYSEQVILDPGVFRRRKVQRSAARERHFKNKAARQERAAQRRRRNAR